MTITRREKKMKKKCKLKICKNWKKSKLCLFLLMYRFSDFDIVDYHFVSINKTKKQFDAALVEFTEITNGAKLTSKKIIKVLFDTMQLYGFVLVDDYLIKTFFIREVPPSISGYKVKLTKE